MFSGNRTIHLLLFVLLTFFFNLADSQIYISDGTSLYIEKNTVISQNLENFVSKSKNLSSTYSNNDSSPKQKKEHLSEKKLKITRQKSEFSDKIKNSQQKKSSEEKNRLISLHYYYRKQDNEHFKISDYSNKPIPATQNIVWSVSHPRFCFTYVYFYARELVYDKRLYWYSQINKCFRTRPPPILLV